MYECIIVKPYRAEYQVLNAEGDLDGESDASDMEIDAVRLRRAHSVTSSTRGEVGSPMDENE